MYTWAPFPFVRFALSAIVGIVLFNNYPNLWRDPALLFLALIGLFVTSWAIWVVLEKKRLALMSGVFGLCLLVFLFGWMAKTNESLLSPGHWRHVAEPITAFKGTVISDVLEKTTTQRYTVRLHEAMTKENESRPVTGEIHLYLKRDSTHRPLSYGDVVLVYASPSQIPPPTNPEEFNYSAYVARQQIHGQCFTSYAKVKVSGNEPPHWWIAKSIVLRNHLKTRLITHIKDEDAQAIALALLIGIKDFLSEDLTTAYASAGAMHVLAVSGLHVGVLYMILLWLLKPLEKYRWGVIATAAISVFVIWGYTFVTGMSPSVLRAATMFSVFATSKAVLRKSNIYNSLGLTAFILLIYDPNLLYQVGFQLSFLAVLGIVYLQPRIYKLVYVKGKLLDKVWMITAVSIAAQIATLPLTIYYFNQFPTYFFLSNLVVIPGAGIIMIGGIALLTIDALAVGLGALLGYVLELVIQLMNWLVYLVEEIPGSLITWLYFDEVEVWGVYLAIILLLLGLNKKRALFLNASLVCALFILTRNWSNQYQTKAEEQLLVYDFKSAIAIDWVKNNKGTLYLDKPDKADTELLRFQVDPYRRAKRLNSYETDIQPFVSLEDEYKDIAVAHIGNKRIIALNKPFTDSVQIAPRLKADLLIINNHSLSFRQKVQDYFDVKLVILGSDNSWNYSEKMKAKLLSESTPVHSLLLDGSIEF